MDAMLGADDGRLWDVVEAHAWDPEHALRIENLSGFSGVVQI